MKQIIVEGGNRLSGEIQIGGMKNSALPIIFSCLLIEGDCVLENIPRVSDVSNALSILRKMGAEASFIDEHTVKINTKCAENSNLDFDLISKMRASSYLMSTCLSRFGAIDMPYPGGCNFGSRPIEQHLKGFEALGAVCDGCNENFISIKLLKKSKNLKIVLDKISVGATINMVMASVISDAETIIENVAKEPHVLDLIGFLNSCGADIVLCENKIKVKGVRRLSGKSYRIYSDMIEALTIITYVGIATGEVTMQNIETEHVMFLKPVFDKMNISVSYDNGNILVKSDGVLNGTNITTAPYRGFPTDLHPQFSALLCYCKDGGSITETIFPGRFAYIPELQKMGAQIQRYKNTVKIQKSELYGATLDATDLRAGAALVAAALGAEGTSIINNVNYIVRGYDDLVSKLSSIGANIKYNDK